LPCIFIRLTGCNLRCKYCDTKYAYEDGEDKEVSEIISDISNYNCKLVEITGGEPLLQTETIILANELIKHGYTVLIETNGSLNISKLPSELIRIIDIKTPGSGEVDSFLLKNWDYINSKDEVKFVITSRYDYEWCKNIIKKNGLGKKCKILLS